MRILWVSNATWSNTGYGQQSALNLPVLRELGHEVAELPYYGYAGSKQEVNGNLVYPIGQSQWGDDMIPYAVRDFKADLCITLMDIWVLREGLARDGNFKWSAWCPIDHDPLPGAVEVRLRDNFLPIAMSRFGQEKMAEKGIDSFYIPHGVDTGVYYPEYERKTEFKKMLGFPEDAFVATMVAANKGWPCRKGFTEAFEAFSKFSKRHPDAYLYIHTAWDTRWGGPDLIGLTKAFGIDTEKVRFPIPLKLISGFDSDFMRKVYNASDVLLSPSYGEGFGVPIIEAQACGVPVITTEFSAMPEVTGSGWKVKPDRRWWTPLDSFQVLPCIEGIVDALNKAYQSWSGPNGLPTSWNLQARNFAVDNYDIAHVASSYWKPYFEMVERRIEESQGTLSNQLMSGMFKPA